MLLPAACLGNGTRVDRIMMESRKNPRRPVRQGAWIFPGGGFASIPCMILDLSVAGARLKVDAGTKLPQQFILVMSRDGRLNRRCRTIWRDEDMLGVQFLSRKSLGPKQEEAAARGLAIRLPLEDPEADMPELMPDPDRPKEAASG